MANHVTSFITFENLSDGAKDFLENMNEETLLQELVIFEIPHDETRGVGTSIMSVQSG
jgi:hypothetical protein